MNSLWARLRRRKGVATVVALALVVGVPTTVAVLHRGFPVNDVDLEARDVWVTNGDDLLGGRLNHQIDELDASVAGSSSKLDVLQDSRAYFLTDVVHGSVERIDPAYVSLVDRVTVPEQSSIGYGGDTLGILSPTGTLWAVDASNRLAFDPSKTKAVAKLGKGAQMVVTKTGSVVAIAPSTNRMLTLDHVGGKAETRRFAAPKRFQLTSVGSTPVVLDIAGKRLLTSDGKAIALPGTPLRLQQPGDASDRVVVATGSGLEKVPLGGGDIETVAAGIRSPVTSAAQVSAPVQLNGCSYGAWSGAARYLFACDDRKAVSQTIPEVTSASELAFRVNGSVIALNDLRNGNAWVVSSDMRIVQNWAQLKPNQTEVQGDDGEEKPVLQSYADTLAQRTPENRPPVAVNDSFGVRPGRTTLLPVLDNDSDPDGDVLTITDLAQLPESEGRLDLVDGGRSIQLTPSPDLTGTISFRYSVDDGRGGTASAQVDAALHPDTQNAAPTMTRASTAEVEVGQSVQYDVAQDFIDPDGDDIYLVAAAPTTEDDVQFTPDGYVTFTSKTGQTGSKEVRFTLSDGSATATGSFMVTVQPQGSLDPVAVPDFASGLSGRTLTVPALDNDRSPSGAPLDLVGAKLDGSGGTVTADQDKRTVSFRTQAAGTYYVEYTLGAGAKSTTGIVRFDVVNEGEADAAPVAVKDTAYVRPGEASTVRVLDNDESPSGRVLAVREVDKGDSGADLNVEVLDNAIVKVTAPTVLSKPAQLEYTVSDGVHEATAAIAVVPIPPLVNHQPPIAVDDTATVRAGDIASVAVLSNDYSPDDQPFTLDPALRDDSTAGSGAIAFVSDSVVRYQAPRTAGQYSVTYGITDKFGQKAEGVVTFQVTPRDPSADRAPKPDDLTVRAFAGSSVPVVVPLDGIDPDGDSVTLTGIASQPTLGRISAQNSTSFTYEAYPASSGSDTFTYSVKDVEGKTATGRVDLAVIPRPSTARPPIAVNDTVEVRPGKTASVPVLANDSDPNGFTIALTKKLAEVSDGLTARTAGKVVLLEAPQTEGSYLVQYRITNGQGGTASAYIQVTVSKDAKLRYPTAVDHVLEPDQTAAKNSVRVDALDGATNPSGLVSALKLGLTGPFRDEATVGDDGVITVKPGDERMAITYTVTDAATGLTGNAFIVVPPRGRDTAPPVIKPGLAEQIVDSGGNRTWKLTDIIDVPSGRPATAISAQATNGDGSEAFVDAQTLRYAAKDGYRGPASVTFRVNDGKEPGATKDRITSLVLPITVGNPDQTDVPPTFTPPTIQVQPGESAQTVDLRQATSHPNPAVLSKVTYSSVGGFTSEITGGLSGSTLSAAAPLGTQTGTTARISFTITSGRFTIPGSATVQVVASTRPLATQKNPPQTQDIKRGSSTTLSNAVGDAFWTNPFPGTPLTLKDARQVSGPKGVTVSSSGSSISVSSASGADIGTVTVQYHVEDGTKDPKRTASVTGQYQVTIHDVPSKPSAPANVKAGDASATMTIAAPANNGKTIDRYEVAWAGGTKQVTAIGAVAVAGLTNGKAYSFTVRAHNEDGWGEFSSASASVTPYGTPAAVSGAKLANAGKYAPTTMRLSWTALSGAAQTGGGRVSYSYKFDSDGWVDVGQSNTLTKSGIKAGDHSFQVRATNDGSGKTGGTDTSNTVNVQNEPPPDPSVNLSRGDGVTSSSCQSGCHYMNTSVKDFKPGTYTIHYTCNGANPDYDKQITVGSDGSASRAGTFYCGYDNASVTVNGVKSNVVDFR